MIGNRPNPQPTEKPQDLNACEVPEDWREQLEGSEDKASPLLLDLDGDSIELYALDSSRSVFWYIDQDGFREASSWLHEDDGLLVIDWNGDGVINDNGELFGNAFTEGFQELAAYDSNADGLIDVSDAQFDDLLVWQDANNDEKSHRREIIYVL